MCKKSNIWTGDDHTTITTPPHLLLSNATSHSATTRNAGYEEAVLIPTPKEDNPTFLLTSAALLGYDSHREM